MLLCRIPRIQIDVGINLDRKNRVYVPPSQVQEVALDGPGFITMKYPMSTQT